MLIAIKLLQQLTKRAKNIKYLCMNGPNKNLYKLKNGSSPTKSVKKVLEFRDLICQGYFYSFYLSVDRVYSDNSLRTSNLLLICDRPWGKKNSIIIRLRHEIITLFKHLCVNIIG